LRGQRAVRDVEKRVDLADGAVHAPAVPEVSPVQDELLTRRRRRSRACGFVFCNFCHDRNYRPDGSGSQSNLLAGIQVVTRLSRMFSTPLVFGLPAKVKRRVRVSGLTLA